MSDNPKWVRRLIPNPAALAAMLIICLLFSPGEIRADDWREAALIRAETWMYQIQDLDVDGAIEALAATDYPILVLEPGNNFKEFGYDTAGMIASLAYDSRGNRRLLLAYIDIGQAEDYRTYWGDDWVAPTTDRPGFPDFLITVDPDGWSGNYPVAYWRAEWQALWLGREGIVTRLAELGFDGVYLDWVEAYDDELVAEAALAEGVSPAEAMIEFIERIRRAGRDATADFLVVPQNAPYLLDHDPDRYAATIDALAVEDTWYHGAADADWDDPDAGDLHDRHDDEWSTAARIAQYAKYQTLGLPVFSVDYCIDRDNARFVYIEARRQGLRPLVTRVSLSRLTETPPDEFP